MKSEIGASEVDIHKTKVLSIENVTLGFGDLKALDDVSLDVNENEIVAIIGPNGAGKTCLLNCINGFYRPQSGAIYFNGANIQRLPVYARTRLGIARTFQNIELFNGLTTLENLLAARHLHFKNGLIKTCVHFGWARNEEVAHREIVESIIDFLEIEPIRKKTVGMVPYGMRKRVELGRALAIDPKLLLLDEPMSGMNLEEKEDMARFVIDIYEERKIPIILIEHDMGVVMDIADRVIVFDFGRKIADGTPDEIIHDENVIKAYIGE
jgi:branched-chain amino acid transport system ATP-binding protein